MFSLFGVVVIVVGVSAANAFPSFEEKGQAIETAMQKRCDHSSDSFSYILPLPFRRQSFQTSCICNYAGDEAGQQGPNSGSSWYKNPECDTASFADMTLTRYTRRMWEIKCKCREVKQGTCVMSQLGNQRMPCMVYTKGESTSENSCTEIEYLDGKKGFGVAFCQLPDDF